MRRHLLEDLIVAGSDGVIRLSEELEAEGSQLLEQACQVGLEGIIAKRRQQPYRSGRNGDWLKVKCIQSESFMIVGYELSAAARGGIGSLLLAGKCGNDWAYAGAAGTGFDSKEAASLRSTLDQEHEQAGRPPEGQEPRFRSADADSRNRIPRVEQRRQAASRGV